MADKVLIEVVSQSEGLDETVKKLEEAKQKMKELVSTKTGLEKQKEQWKSSAQVVKQFNKEIEKVDKEINTTRKSIEDFSKEVKKLGGKVIIDEETKSYRVLRREIELKIKALKDAGQEGTKAYNDLIQQAAKLTKAQNEVNKEIKSLSSVTYAFDAALQGTQLLAGGFSVAQGAAALFGAESEDLQKIMVKLQSVIAITTGLQSIGNAVQKESSLMKALSAIQAKALARAELQRAAATEVATTATKGATVAQIKWNIATYANPYVLLALAIGAVIGAIVIFSKSADEASEKSKKYKSTTDDLRFATKEARDEHDKFNRSIRDIGIEIDVVIGKLSSYGAAILKFKNELSDEISEINKEEDDQIEKLNEKFNSFWEKSKRLYLIFVVGILNSAKIEAAFLEEHEKKLSEIKEKAQEKRAEKTKLNNEKVTLENEKHNKNILEQNEDLNNENIKGIEGSLAKIATARERHLKAAKKENEDRIKEGKEILHDIDAIKKKYDDQAKEARKAEADRLKSEQEKMNDAELKLLRDLKDARLAAMSEGEAKEKASIKQTLERRLSEIKGNSQVEIDLRKQLEENAISEIEKITNKYDTERKRSGIETEISIINAKLAEVERGSELELNLRKNLLEEKARLDSFEIEKSTQIEEWKSAKILEINANLIADLKDLSADYIRTADERAKSEVLALTQSYEQGKMNKFAYEREISNITISALQDEIAEREFYGQDTVNLEQRLSEQRISIAEKEKEYRKQLFDELYGAMTATVNLFFDMQKEKLNQELSDLNHYYTTDREEAKKNKEMKLISEEELNRRQIEIKRKQAQAEKNQALFNAFVNMAQGITKALGAAPPPFNIALAAITAAQAAIQIAAINSRPLPRYWKGRRGGKGEFAIFGEYGPEIAWIPKGASIMPAHETRRAIMGDNKTFDRWNMPRIDPKYPSIPTINRQLVNQYYQNLKNEDRIDYDLLGKSVAKYMKFPKQKDVSINFDKSGLSVTEGNTTTHILNAKYSR